MPVTDSDLEHLTSAEAAIAAHRRELAEAAEWNRILRAVDLDTAERLAKALPDRPTDAGSLVFARTGDHAKAVDSARRLAELAGADEAGFAWAAWEAELRLRAARAEETWVTKTDELEHADDYGVEVRSAEWDAAIAKAEADALKAAIAEVAKKRAGASTKARAKRASAAGE